MNLTRVSPYIYRKVCSLLTLLIFTLVTACAPISPLSPAAQAESAAEETSNETSKKPAVESGEPATADKEISKSTVAGEALLLFNNTRAETFELVRVNLQTGKPVDDAESIDIGSEITYTFSPDHTRLAVASKGSGCAGACLRLFELPGLKQVLQLELPAMRLAGDWVHQIAFDPRGERIALALIDQGTARIAVVDLTKPVTGMLQVASLPVNPRKIAFTGDGARIMLIGAVAAQDPNNPPSMIQQVQALLFDARTLGLDWQQDLPGVKDGYFGPTDHSNPEEIVYYEAGIAVDAAGQRIYIAHADEERLTTVDFKERTSTTTIVPEKQALLEHVVEFILSIGVRPVHAKAANMFVRGALLSDDGQMLYIVGQQMLLSKESDDGELISENYGLGVWDIQSGMKVLHVDTQADMIRQAPEGKILLKGYDRAAREYHPFTEVFDPSSGKITARLEDANAYLTLSLDGRPVLVSSYFDENGKAFLSVLDVENPNSVLSWTQNSGYPEWLELR